MSQSTEPLGPNPYAAPSPATDTLAPPAAPALPMDEEVRALFTRGKNGAAWFYWIAALTLINSCIMLAGGDRNFVLGLAVTALADLFATLSVDQGAPHWVKFIVFGVDLVAIALVALCGWLSQKRVILVYALGMVLYLLDTPVALLTGILGFLIHLFALWGMWSGFSAFRQIAKLEQRMLEGGS